MASWKDDHVGRLHVAVHEARDLYVTQMVGKQDPYVKATLDQKTHCTKPSNDTHKTAKWEVKVVFRVYNMDKPLVIEVCNKNVVSDAFIGKEYFKVKDCIADAQKGQKKWYRIGRNAKQARDAGTILLSFQWEPKDGPKTESASFPSNTQEDAKDKAEREAEEKEMAIARKLEEDALKRMEEEEARKRKEEEAVAAAAAAAALAAAKAATEAKEAEKAEAQRKAIEAAAAAAAVAAATEARRKAEEEKKKMIDVGGDWRVCTKDKLGRQRSYAMTLRQTADGVVQGQGQAAHMKFIANGNVKGNRIFYTETWYYGTSYVDCILQQDGCKFKMRHADGTVLKAKKITDKWNRESHPHYFVPYYNLSGAWRIFIKQENKKKNKVEQKSYSLELHQDPVTGDLTGSGIAGTWYYEVKGQVNGNVVKYTETWEHAPDQPDHVEAEIKEDGAYFVCRPKYALVQEARLIMAMSNHEKKKYNAPF